MMSIFVRTAIPLSLVLTAVGAHSQDDDFDDLFLDNNPILEEIKVVGFRSRLVANLNQKRFSDAVLDGISAEDIGKFPDKNIADSLQRVTGVSITRDFGEGEKISIRGTAPGLNRTLLNGQNVATADWFILDNPTRSFNYSLLASEMVSALEVYKSPQADIDEGSIGGTVILRTRRPLSVESNTFVLSTQMAYTDISEEWDPQLSGFYSWRNDNETIGALVSVVSQKRNLRRDGFEILGYTERTIDDQLVQVPDLIGSSMFTQNRERTGVMLSLQYKPKDTLLFTFNGLHSKLDANNTNHNMLAVPTWEFDAARAPDGPVYSDVTIRDGTVMAMTYGAADRAGAVLNVANRTSFSETSSFDLDIMYDPGNYQLHAQFGITEAEGGTTSDSFSEFSAQTRQQFDLGQKVPQVSFLDIDVTDATEFSSFDWAHVNSKPQDDEEIYAQVDFEYFLDGGFFNALKVGLKMRDHTKKQNKIATRFHNPLDATDGGILGDLQAAGASLDDYSNRNLPSDFMDGIAIAGSLTNYPLLNSAEFERDLFAETDASRRFTREELPDFFDINEKILASYLKLNFETESYRGNIGLRYVQTDLTSKAWRFDGSWVAPDNAVIQSTSSDYSDILPSLNITYDLTEEMILRFAAAKVMSRPEYSQITDARTLNPDTQTGTGGNPNLDPFRANQADISYEWYFEETGLFSAAIFYKDIESYTTNSFVDEIHFNERFDEDRPYSVSIPVNGDGGTNKGLEISYQQDIYGGFGLLTNYTYSDAEADNGSLIPGNSEHTYNLTVYYEDDKLSTRISYNSRTEYFEGLDRGSVLMTDGFAQMDGSISYKITDNISLVLQALNLTDEEIYKYSDITSRPYSFYKNGRRFFIGAQLSY